MNKLTQNQGVEIVLLGFAESAQQSSFVIAYTDF
jgi:hypothetical protein